MSKHINIIVEGTVQGVWFRDSTLKEAKQLGINGFVRNEPDGSVYIEAEGEPDKLDEFVKWCHSGSERAVVTNVDVSEGKFKDFIEFVIQWSQW